LPFLGSTPADMLHQLAHAGLRQRYGSRSKQHVAQLSSAPSSSSSNNPYPRSTDGMHDVTRKTKSGINEF
jgi:hypothetical protein